MRIIDRYVLWTFLKNYVISFMVLIGMYVVLDMVFNFDDLVGLRGSGDTAAVASVLGTIRDIADYYFFQSFMFFVHLSGIIPVVAAAFTLMRLSRFNELTAMLAAGVPLLRIAMPIILAGVVLNVLMIADQELLIPELMPKLTRSHDEVHRTDDKWFPINAMQDDQKGLLYASKYYPSAHHEPARIEVFDLVERGETGARPAPAGAVASAAPAAGDEAPAQAAAPTTAPAVVEPKSHISADRALWNAQAQRWDLFMWDAKAGQFAPGGLRVTGLTPDALQSTVEKVTSYQSNITPEEIALYRSGDFVEMLSTARIDQLIARPGSYGQTNLLRVKHWRFTQPIMNVILLLLAIPCVLTREPGHLKQAATKCLILTGLGMGSIFLAHQVAGNPPSGAWATTWPAVMAWVPIFIFGPFAVYLLDRVKT